MLKLVRRGSITVLLVVTLIIAALYFYLKTSLPQTAGTLHGIKGLSAEVEILRDEQGIPSIFAQNRLDAYRGLGFAHAQDRLWQMEMQRHIAQGRISELVGEGQVKTDKFLRALGVWPAAQAAWETMRDQRTRAELQAYADGVNAYLEQRSGALPVEFLALGLPAPEPWEPVHSIGWMKMMAFDLGTNWRKELDRFRMAMQAAPKLLSNAHIQDLEGRYIGEPNLELPDLRKLYLEAGLSPFDFDDSTDDTASLSFFADPSDGLGSNNWVVGGDRSASGKPLLANDPHLTMSLPGIWYFARLKGGPLNGVGATLPGVPYIVIGRNEAFGWGFTNGYPDVQDLTIEKMLGEGLVERAGAIEPIISREETIKVKGGDDISFWVRSSTYGSFISDGMDQLAEQLGPDFAMAMQWTALEPSDTSLEAMSCIIDVRAANQIHSCLSKFYAPQQNTVYAFTDGEFGMIAPGRVPVRDPANPTYGHAPAIGWDATTGWRSYLSVRQVPQEANPARGFAATANARNHGPNYPHYMGHDFRPDYRLRQIEKLILATDQHDQASFLRILADETSTLSNDVLELLTKGLNADGTVASQALDLLKNWDGAAPSDRPEPAIFWVYVDKLLEAIYKDEFGNRFEEMHKLRVPFLIAALSDVDVGNRWCSEATSSQGSACLDLRLGAFEEAIEVLTKAQGSEPDQWQWGQQMQHFAGHLVFADIAPLDRLFNVVTPGRGGKHSVNVTGFDFGAHAPYRGRVVASLRHIYDFDDLEQSVWNHSGGQSGNIFSPHYSDMHSDWSEVKVTPMRLDEHMLRQAGGDVLRLKP